MDEKDQLRPETSRPSWFLVAFSLGIVIIGIAGGALFLDRYNNRTYVSGKLVNDL